eukprot:GEMP01108118.1.p1 GENE.GEMP01108118.1~~GEMP01108118.1.p1  ORF type:complete len:156 (-),score=7.87 GEMP01108118.1:19-486(-)
MVRSPLKCTTRTNCVRPGNPAGGQQEEVVDSGPPFVCKIWRTKNGDFAWDTAEKGTNMETKCVWATVARKWLFLSRKQSTCRLNSLFIKCSVVFEVHSRVHCLSILTNYLFATRRSEKYIHVRVNRVKNPSLALLRKQQRKPIFCPAHDEQGERY